MCHIKYYAHFYRMQFAGLDPAKPMFIFASGDHKLGKDDALFVDVIHTDILQRGVLAPAGHCDFYVNGGIEQPGCATQTNSSKLSIIYYIVLYCWQSKNSKLIGIELDYLTTCFVSLFIFFSSSTYHRMLAAMFTIHCAIRPRILQSCSCTGVLCRIDRFDSRFLGLSLQWLERLGTGLLFAIEFKELCIDGHACQQWVSISHPNVRFLYRCHESIPWTMSSLFYCLLLLFLLLLLLSNWHKTTESTISMFQRQIYIHD